MTATITYKTPWGSELLKELVESPEATSARDFLPVARSRQQVFADALGLFWLHSIGITIKMEN